jgi:hypothetical protein
MSSENLQKACNKKGLFPPCDHSAYRDGHCVLVTGGWHLSYPGHGRSHGIPQDKVKDTFFYTSNRGRSLYNTGRTHRWSTTKDKNKYTYCASKTMWVGGKTLHRVPFRGVATRVNAYTACQKYNMVPVLDHNHYKHYGREAWGYQHWHFSHPHHNMHYGIPIYKVSGAYFYTGGAHHGWMLQNRGYGRGHRWSGSGDKNGETFCVNWVRNTVAGKTQWVGMQFQHWYIGDRGRGHFDINNVHHHHHYTPQLLIRRDSRFFRRHRVGRAPNGWRHHGQTSHNIRLGNWFIGARDHHHFVISKITTGICQFLVRHDSIVFAGHKHGRAGNNWRHTGKSHHVLEFGQWLVGPKDDNHFAITHKPTGTCTTLIRHDGYIFFSHEHGTAHHHWRLNPGMVG